MGNNVIIEKLMKRFFSKIFKLANWKRIILLFLTIFFSVGAITWGGLGYVAKNSNVSVEFGGGVEALVQVKSQEGKNADDSVVNNVQKSIFDRLTGGTGLNGTSVSIEGEGKILVSKNGISSDAEKADFINEIIRKPELSITDIYGNPLFYDGVFVANGSRSRNEVSWAPPLKPNSASSRPGQNGKNEVLIDLKNTQAEAEWSKATSYISRQQKPVILMWLNLKELIKMAEEKYPVEWERAGKNPYNFIHVNEKSEAYKVNVDGEEKEFKPVLKEKIFNAKDYLISDAGVQQALSGPSFVISGNFTAAEASQLALNISYGSAEYSLSLLSSNFIPAKLGNEAFEAAIIAGIIAFSIIALFLIVNYGLLGALSTISLALYVFLTLLFFTIIRGEYSPATIAALVIGIGMSVDANVITFERLKKEIYEGNSMLKSYAKSSNQSLGTILNSNITTFLVAIILFYFGTKGIKGFSITLILSIIFTLFASLVFTKLLTNLLVRTGWFNNKKLYLLGIQPKYIKKIQAGYVPILERPNYIKHSRLMNFIPLLIIITGIGVFAYFAISAKSFSSGFVKGIDFSGGTQIIIESSDLQFQGINAAKAQEIMNLLIANGVESSGDQIKMLPVNSEGTLFNISVSTTQDLTAKILDIEQVIKTNFGSSVNFNSYSISTQEAENLVKNAILAVSISLGLVVLYTLFVLKWTFSIAAIIALIHDIVIVIALFIIFRLEFSVIFIAAALSIIGYSINNTIVTFDRIKEVMIRRYSHVEIFDKAKLKEIANVSIKDIIKRSLLTSFTTIVTVIILISFRKSTDLYFNLALLFGLIFGTFSSLILAPQIWVYLELFRNKMKNIRIKKNFWNTQSVKEQTFKGINDFRA